MEEKFDYCFLGFDSILGEGEIETLFEEPDTPQDKNEDNGDDKGEPSKEENENKKNDTAEDVNPDELFEAKREENPESVGGGKDEEQEKEDTSTGDGSGASPNNFYSSIANAMAVDGIFPNLTEDVIKGATDAEGLSNLIEAEVNARLDDKQRRISKALESGVGPTDIKRYENTLGYVNSITDAQLSEEGEKGEQLRRSLIYQDFLNKGYTPDKAQKYTERTIDAGTDIEDAKDALQSNREYFSNAYNKLLKDAEDSANKEREERRKQAEKLRTSLLNDKQLMGDMEISNDLRKKAFDNIAKPIYRDPDSGEYFTAIQKYEMEHRSDFLKYAGLIYTLTNGFKDFSGFVKGKVKKEVKKGLRELEHTLNNTSRTPNGELRMVTSVKDDPYAYLGKGVQLDL
jgi:hypothetical protein